MFVDIVEIVGSLLVLAAFAAAQKGLLDVRSPVYLGLNVAGSLVLALIAAAQRSWGFLLLEGVWAIVSTISLVGVVRQHTAGGGRAAGGQAP